MEGTIPRAAGLAIAVLTGAAVASAARAQDGGVDPEEAEIAAELAQIQARQATEEPAAPPPAADDTGATASSRGLSNLLNPAISANGLFLAGYSSRPEADAVEDREDLETGLAVQEVEVAFSAIVDPYLRADMILAANLDEIGVEEAYVTTLEIPRLTIRGGLFKAALGRHNLLHTHAFPFLTGPLPWRALLGPEGLADPGVSFELLLPLRFYTEVKGQVFAGEWPILAGSIPDDPLTPIDESVPDRRKPEDLAYVAHLATLFDLSDATTLGVGATYLGGRHGFDGWTSLVAGNVTLKWSPLDRARYTSFEWQTEWLWIDRPDAPGEEPTGGGHTHVRYQFAQRWWTQVRGAVSGVPGPSDDRTWRGEALLAYVPDEFAALRLQYGIERAEAANAPLVHDVVFQLVFSIGSHPAHAY